MTIQRKPIIHGRDHATGGADPIPGLGGGGIQFDTDPQEGGFLDVTTTDGKIEFEADGGSLNLGVLSDNDLNIYTEDADATINISGGAGVLLEGSGDSGVILRASGGGDLLILHTAEGGNIKLTTAADGWVEINIGFGGLLRLIGLPTSDPSTTGALWNDGGTLKIS